jgi:predicted metal-binding membrane protein
VTGTTLAGAASPSPRLAAWRQRAGLALAWRPEWPAVLVALTAWAALVALDVHSSGGALGLGIHAGHAGPGAHTGPGHVHDPAAVTATGQPVPGTVLEALLGWGLMATAMMTPVALPALQHVALNSLVERRRRAMALHLAGYLAVWTAFGVVPLAIVAGARAAGASRAAIALGLLVGAAGWQLTPWKRRGLVGCGRTVALPPWGWRADRACLRFGVLQARACVLTCGPLMSTMLVAGRAAVPAMAGLTAVVLAERGTRNRARMLRIVAAGLALTAVGSLVLAGGPPDVLGISSSAVAMVT